MSNVDCKCNVIVIVILIHNYPFRLFYGDWGSILTSCHVALEWPIKISAACSIQNSFTITNWITKAKKVNNLISLEAHMVIHPISDSTVMCHVSVVALLWHCCSTVVALLWHCCSTVVALLWHCCGTVVALLWHCCSTVVALLWHCCGTVVALLWHCCGTVMVLS